MESIASRISGEKLFNLLSEKLSPSPSEYVVLVAAEKKSSPFSILVGTILSQNTNDKNSIRAYISLKQQVGISAKEIVEADIEVIEKSIRTAGLAKRKAETLKRLAQTILEAGGEEILSEMPVDRLRDLLLSIKGVGRKTVDVFLSFYRKAPVFAVDTHAARIAKRWGLVEKNADYDKISRTLLDYFKPERSEEAHRFLIALGRRYCRARKPMCSSCPVNPYCPKIIDD